MPDSRAAEVTVVLAPVPVPGEEAPAAMRASGEDAPAAVRAPGEDAPAAVRASGEDAPAAVRTYLAEVGGQRLGRVAVGVADGRLRMNADPPVVAAGQGVRRGLLRAVSELARSEGLAEVAIGGQAPTLLRHEARLVGFTGPLRGDLVSGDAPAPFEGAVEESFLAAVAALLPETSVSFAHPPRGFRSLLRTTTRANGALSVLATRGTEPSLRMSMPFRDDVMPEAVALILDTALSVRRCFRPSADRVRVFVDQSGPNGKWAAYADQMVRDVHVMQGYTLARDMELLDESLRVRREKVERDQAHGRQSKPLRRSYSGAPPFTRIDAIVAHEFWHQIEFDIDSGRYREGVDMRRTVGQYFGVESLEQALKGNEQTAPEAWRRARLALCEEVSTYAATTPKEALAEIFSIWWCTPTNPPPVAVAFAAALRQLFPTAELGRS